jgi:ABC-type ATPase with predicted acetyltransferase domain
MSQSRVIIHPKFRGIGLGEFLVKQTLLLANASVEFLVVMARYNPFFERAGMVKVNYGRDVRKLQSTKNQCLLERAQL